MFNLGAACYDDISARPIGEKLVLKNKKVRKQSYSPIMEDKLIYFVSLRPELWDTRLNLYRDLNRKGQRWREISDLLNLPGLLKMIG